MTQHLTLQPSALAEYQEWLNTIKQRIVSVRLRMALAASRELILFYWDLGAMISQKQAQSQWGDKLIAQLSADLHKAFPDIKGLSASNLKYCLRFFQFYSADPPIGQQSVDQLPWGHNIQIFTKCQSVAEARFYIEQTLKSRGKRKRLVPCGQRSFSRSKLLWAARICLGPSTAFTIRLMRLVRSACSTYRIGGLLIAMLRCFTTLKPMEALIFPSGIPFDERHLPCLKRITR